MNKNYVKRDYNKSLQLLLTVRQEVHLEDFKTTNVKKIFSHSVSIISALITASMMEAEQLSEMFVCLNHLTRLSAREKCVEVSHETLKS